MQNIKQRNKIAKLVIVFAQPLYSFMFQRHAPCTVTPHTRRLLTATPIPDAHGGNGTSTPAAHAAADCLDHMQVRQTE